MLNYFGEHEDEHRAQFLQLMFGYLDTRKMPFQNQRTARAEFENLIRG